MSVNSFLHNKIKKKEKGFSLIELLIVLGIIGIMSVIIMFDYNTLQRNIHLSNDAHLLALHIKETQIYGMSRVARKTSTVDFGEYYNYGLYFDISNNIGDPNDIIDNTKFIMYIDGFNINCALNYQNGIRQDIHPECTDGFNLQGSDCFSATPGSSNECFSVVNLKGGNRIKRIEVKDGGIWTEVSKIDIQFRRPNPDAIIRFNNNTKSRARIYLEDRNQELEKCVEIGSAGDISVGCN